MAGCDAGTTEKYDDPMEILGRGAVRKITRKIRLSFTPEADKQGVYAQSAKQLLTDQIAFLRDAFCLDFVQNHFHPLVLAVVHDALL